MKLPPYAKKYFWNVKADQLDTRKDAEFITYQLLEHGNPESVRWLLRHIPRRKVKEVLMKRRGFSTRNASFWSLFLNVPKEKVTCLKKSYQRMRKSHWPY